MRATTALAPFILFATIAGCGDDARFDMSLRYHHFTPSSGGVSSEAMADFDRDGRLDYVISDDDGIAIMYGKASGLEDVQRTGAANSARCRVLEAVDVDRDGTPDITCLVSDKPSVITMRGLGNRELGPPVLTQLPAGTRSIIAADLDADGLPDLLARAVGPMPDERHTVTVMRGAGDGTFATGGTFDTTGPCHHYTAQLERADLDNDGRLDLVDSCGKRLYITPGASDGLSFAAPAILDGFSKIDETTDMAFGLRRINSDGRIDIVVIPSTPERSFLSAPVMFFSNHGNLGFSGAFPVDTDYEGERVRPEWSGDFNGDGQPDFFGTRGEVLLHAGIGAAGSGQTYDSQSYRYVGHVIRDFDDARIGDLNGDGRDDVVLFRREGGMWVMLSELRRCDPKDEYYNCFSVAQ